MVKNIICGTIVPVLAACLASVTLRAQAPQNPAVWNSKIEKVATLPSPGNTENLTQADDGSFYITSLSDRILWRVSPNGNVEKFFSEPSRSAFVGVSTSKGEVVLGVFQRPYLRPNAGGQPGGRAALDMSNVGSQILVLDNKGKLKATIDGQMGQFFNGIARAGEHVYLITDTNGSTVLRLDSAHNKIEPWIQDPLLARQNGIKVHNGWAYIACGDKIYRVQIDSNVKPKGGPVLFAQGVPTDDFGIAGDGTLYITTGATVMKVSPTGEVSKFLEDAPNGASAWVTKDNKWLYWATRLGDADRQLVRIALK